MGRSSQEHENAKSREPTLTRELQVARSRLSEAQAAGKLKRFFLGLDPCEVAGPGHDALNGVGTMIEHFPGHLDMLAGDRGSVRGISGLAHEVEDAIALNFLDTKRGVDGEALLEKIDRLSPESRRKLVRASAEFWARTDDAAVEVLSKAKNEINDEAARAGRKA